MPSEILNPRRAPRLPLRYPVEIRHRLATWSGWTEDVGPRGCQVVAGRIVEPGKELRLSVRVEAIGRTVVGTGRVVWTSSPSPSRLGVTFRVPGGDGWFEALARAEPAAVRAAGRTLERLPRKARLFLGRPPRLVVDFSPDEREILRRVGGGTTVDALDRSFGEGLDAAARGALFSLVTRGLVVLDPTASAGVEAWRALLPRGEEIEAAPLWPPARAPDVQRLYDEGLAHLGTGRVTLALDRFQTALVIDPLDEAIAGTVRRLSRWT